MGKGSRLAGTMLGSALAAIPTAKAVADSEPINNTFPGETAAAGVTLTGFLCAACGPSDILDFYQYTGLPAGGSFDLLFDPEDRVDPFALRAGLYSDQTTILSPRPGPRSTSPA
jgi:hypothetical protein